MTMKHARRSPPFLAVAWLAFALLLTRPLGVAPREQQVVEPLFLEDGEGGEFGGVCSVMNEFNAEKHKTVYKVGVLAIRGFEAAYDEFNKTFTDYLTVAAGQRFDPPISFEIKPLNFNLLFSDVEDSIVDFIYVNPSAFSCIESEYTARSLVSQISRRNIGGNTYALKKFGGVIAARADRDDINNIYDLQGKVIAAASISGLGSGQMQFLEMQRAGMSYINDPKQLVFTSNQGKVVNGVLSGDFDVGFIRTDQIERTKNSDGVLVNVTDFKIIEPRTNYIDGEEFPFTASTPLYPEWNIAALDHVAEDVSREVQNAMLAIAEHASVGRAILDCRANHNETYCNTNDSYGDGVRCDTTTEIALTAAEAMQKGKYSGWQTTLSYMQLRSMQEGTGFIRQDVGTNIWRCVRSKEIYDAISCPEGFYRKTKEEVETSCAAYGLECKEGFQCLCSPCAEIQVCYDAVEIGDDCVPYKVFLPALLVPIFSIIIVMVQCYVVHKRRLADAVWEVKEKELTFEDPPTVIGVGTFGYVLLAEYRGTQVAVKRVLPPEKAKELEQPARSVESNPGLRSVAYGRFKRARGSETFNNSISHSATGKSLSRKQLKLDLIREMRQLSKLRHPCITTVMGAVLNRVSDPMLIMEYLAFGSLYDVLRDNSLQTQIDENYMHMLQDIARGLRFLHGANPEVIHGDLKSRNVLIDTNFNAKVSDFGLSVKRKSGASGTPYWMAPELLENRCCNTTRSDIFSYGILMYEIFSRQNPYEGEHPDIVLEQICDRSENKRPMMPANCPLKMNDLYQECIKWDPTQRPTAEAIDLLLRVEGSVKERVFRLENLNRELAEANAKIASASAMQLQHFACMSHEIRTPLNCIVGLSSLMESTDLTPQNRDNVKMIVSSGKLLRHIVDDVLDYSKLESGAMEVDIKEANLQDVLLDSVNSMSSSSVTEKLEVSIRTFYDARLLPSIQTDGRRLQQIMYNLLSNAVKFSKQGGTVELSAKFVEIDSNIAENHPLKLDNAKRILRLAVKDYGKGIEQKEFENIFHPFTQTKTGINNTEGGTGLGLSITRKLVQSLGGSMAVDSEVGMFSEFTIDFPHSGEIADVQEVARKLSNVTVLLIDSKSMDTERITSMFRLYNTEITQYETLESLQEGWGSSFTPQAGRTYICMVRCAHFHRHVLESLFGDQSYEIVTYGSSKGLEKSSRHYVDPTIIFPAFFMKEMERIAKGSERTSFTRLASDVVPSEVQLAEIWKHLRVLVAEDNLVNQKVVRRLLNKIGVQNVTVVPDGQQAVEKDAAEEFDIVLMDMQMPVMDGVEATRLIVRRNGPHPLPKIVFLSAHVSDSFKDMCLESGAVGYLPKPCTLGGLRDVLTETVLAPKVQPALPTPRARRQVRFDEDAV